MHKLTRIAYNSANWQRPTGEAGKQEVDGTFNHENKFGLEDWLFHAEWQIDGWRYAFIQGVNKSHAKLIKEALPVDITLFTIQPDKKRRYVAYIEGVECLSVFEAVEAVSQFKERGWYDEMVKDIKSANGNVAALGPTKWVEHVLNVRFRQENVRFFPPGEFAAADDPVMGFKRYILYDYARLEAKTPKAPKKGPKGDSKPPEPKSWSKKGIPPVECTPQHAKMQAMLMKDLNAQYPNADVVREWEYVDVTVKTDSELILFEIKSDLDPRSVIRQALGQILEYAYHPNREHDLPVRLVIVGRNKLTAADKQYLDHLKDEFDLPLSYRVVSI
jgi:hypothetical protein